MWRAERAHHLCGRAERAPPGQWQSPTTTPPASQPGGSPENPIRRTCVSPLDSRFPQWWYGSARGCSGPCFFLRLLTGRREKRPVKDSERKKGPGEGHTLWRGVVSRASFKWPRGPDGPALQRPPLADSERARGHFRARAEGAGLGCLSQGAALTLVAIAFLDSSSQRPGGRGQ